MYLAIDLGTTGCRSMLFDSGFQVVAASYEEYPLITPREGWVEQDATLWWQLTLRTARQAIEMAGIDPGAIRGISVSSQGITLVPVDEQLEPLCNAISWLDTRAQGQTQRLGQQLGAQALFHHTGKPLNACYTLPKLLWLLENRPELCSRAYKFLMPMDYLLAKLTGVCVTDHSMASGTQLYDISNCCWSRKILSLCGISESQLPALGWSGQRVGTVLPQVAAQLGLRPDCLVALGAQDQKCAALGAGLAGSVMTLSLGTAGAITKLWSAPEIQRCTCVGWCGYVRPGTWVTEGVINTAGTCLRWVRDLLFPGEDYEAINREAAQALEQGSSLLFYPYMGGPSAPDYYPDAQGSFYGLSLSTRRGHMAAAVMEGVAFQVRILLEAMEAYGTVDSLVLFGGGAKSPLWCQIMADITGMQICVPVTEEAAGAGAAMLAAQALGQRIEPLPWARRYSPGEDCRDYGEKYARYRAVEKKLWGRDGA